MRFRRQAHFETLLAALMLAVSPFAASAQEPQVTPLQATPNATSPIPNALTSKSAIASIPNAQTTPIAIVPVEGVELTGALNIAEGKAAIAKSGTVTAGKRTAKVTLPHRGELLLCATSKVNLTTDSSVASNEAPGLMMAIDSGALEAKFATGKNSDVVLTPDFRILISGPGIADVRIRLGQKGDTCVDNSGADAPYVAVSSVFDGGVYRVQAGQRVMFQHGSLTEVVDNERESCGCPPEPPTLPTGNAFPIAQSAGLAPNAPTVATQSGESAGEKPSQTQASLGYNAGEVKSSNDPNIKPDVAKPDALAPAATLADAAANASKPAPLPKKQGAMHRIGRFFKRVFGG